MFLVGLPHTQLQRLHLFEVAHVLNRRARSFRLQTRLLRLQLIQGYFLQQLVVRVSIGGCLRLSKRGFDLIWTKVREAVGTLHLAMLRKKVLLLQPLL